MSDAAPRRSSRNWLLLPLILAAVLAALWCGYWYVARGRLLAAMDGAVVAQREQGRAVEWASRRVGGFPFRFKVILEQAQVRSPSGWAVQAPRLEASANAYRLTQWLASAPEGITVVRPVAGPVRVTGRVLRASLAGADRSPPRLSVEGADLRFAPEAGAEPFLLAGAERLELHLRPAPDAEGDAALLLRLRGAQPRPAGLMAFISGAQPANLVWDARITEWGALAGPDWARAVRSWSEEGGRMEVRDASLQAGELRARNQGGRLSVGADGRLRGRVAVHLNRPLQALSAMTRIEQADGNAVGAATAVARARGETDVTLDLGFEAGQFTVGPVAVAPAPKVF
jgi:hypothetical protein